MEKQTYVAPSIETIEVENEGVIAVSTGRAIQPGGSLIESAGRRNTRGQYNSSFSDLEDMINNILTFEK